MSRLESSTLRALSDATGGIYRPKGRVLPLEELYRRAIAAMEGRNLVDGKERVPRDRYQGTPSRRWSCSWSRAPLRDARARREA